MTDVADLPPQAVRLPDPPTDGITGLAYLSTSGSSSKLLASASWDGSLRIHDTGDGSGSEAKLQVSHHMGGSPLLTLADNGEGVVYTGGLDGSVQSLTVATNQRTLVGKHTSSSPETQNHATAAACSCLALLPPLVVTAGWDKHLYVWDVRASESQAATQINLPGKAFAMDVDPQHSRVAVGCSGRQTRVFDLRRPDEGSVMVDAGLAGESSQKHQTRCLQFFPDGQRIAVGSVEGRVSVEWVDGRALDNDKVMPKEYAFKCHRRNDLVFPVNCIEFHPIFGTFATGGGDGTVGTLTDSTRSSVPCTRLLTHALLLCCSRHPPLSFVPQSRGTAFIEND
jgi:cell cycle arrest protein BUB3